jgi:diguanylate cyclase (GGDEF)-like protein
LFNEKNGLTNGHVHDVIEDDVGNIWVTSNSGLFRILRKDIDAIKMDDTVEFKIVKYSEKDGMVNSEFNGSSSGAVKTENGLMWFASQGGVVVVDSEKIFTARKKELTPFIEHMYVDEKQILQKDKHNIEPNPGSVHFHFGAVFLSDARNLSYRYKLKPLMTGWNEQRVADFMDLDYGQYDLTVQVRYKENEWSTPLYKTFYIEPAWFQTWWFRFLFVLLSILLLFGLPYWRIKSLNESRRQLKKRVEEQTKSLVLANERLQLLSRVDELTDIANRRAFISKIEKHCQKSNPNICLALIDVDNFKAYNDYYGHVAGDECLIKIARILSVFSNEHCLVARFGGEEFVMLFNSVTLKEAEKIVENMHNYLESKQYPHEKSKVKDFVSLSSGLVKCRKNESVESLIDRADKAMYQAKSKGKNRIVVGETVVK